MKRISYLLLFWHCCVYTSLHAQETFPQSAVSNPLSTCYCLLNVNLQKDPTTLIPSCTLVVKNGKIFDYGQKLTLPQGCISIPATGKYVYPSFIEMYSDYGISKSEKKSASKDNDPQNYSGTDGAFAWNEALKPEFDAVQQFVVDGKKAEDLRKFGFGASLSHRFDGICRGSGAVVLLGDLNDHEMILKEKAAAFYSFSKGSSSQEYPSSLMGAIALLRQSFYDANWYKNQNPVKEVNLSLNALNQLQSLPQIFEANHRLNILRADKLGDEFNKQIIIKGSGDEYRRIEEIKNTKATLIIPVNFPDPYEVADPFQVDQIKLSDLLHWELAASNPNSLFQAQIKFCLTAQGIKTSADFFSQLRKVYQRGLPESEILHALTTLPASLLGIENQVGKIEKNYLANFFITNGPFLSEKSAMISHWIKGKPYQLQELTQLDPRGTYEINLNNNTYALEIKGPLDALESSIKLSSKDSAKSEKVKMNYDPTSIGLSFQNPTDTSSKSKGSWRLNAAWTSKGFQGLFVNHNNITNDFEAVKTNYTDSSKFDLPKLDTTILAEVRYPFSAYGYTDSKKPKAETVLFKNATIWTCEKEGKIENMDLLIQNGKILKLGKNLPNANQYKVIDATGKHITPGIIDEHSHIAIQNGVNEGTQASTAEVRISDVTYSEDINIYRQLAGGVTLVQSLHGSANPIGGQSAIIKLRWGKSPEEMQVKGAKGFIKFALGENVKQSNWGEKYNQRFPQTRMGVEQVYEDLFTQAKEYEVQMKKDSIQTRKNLELDALLEILRGKRFISCHSYVQSEITMLMRVAEKHGFKVNTFTHILEGYKVADKMKAHGAGASSFSDWWAYKYEVMDAIPYNAKIMNDMGIVTALNSDDAEMGRRLNQEAAKGVKYGNMSEEDALKMVTLNPAKLLKLDEQLGSIKQGKDADIVLWSEHPLSIFSKAEQTYVDGICYYDRKEDAAKREEIAKERNRIILKMIQAKANGSKTQSPSPAFNHYYHCTDIHLNELKGINWKVD